MRLFIAVEPSDNIKQYLKSVQGRISSNYVRMSLVREFHLTLKFLGEVDESRLGIITKNLRKLIFNPFEVRLSNLGVFPNLKKARVLWVGVKPETNIKEIATWIDNALIDEFEPNKRFYPHITIGRIKQIYDRKYFKELLEMHIDEMPFIVDKVKLIKSTLTALGPIYEVIESFNMEEDSND